jgi:hypothetical protein
MWIKAPTHCHFRTISPGMASQHFPSNAIWNRKAHETNKRNLARERTKSVNCSHKMRIRNCLVNPRVSLLQHLVCLLEFDSMVGLPNHLRNLCRQPKLLRLSRECLPRKRPSSAFANARISSCKTVLSAFAAFLAAIEHAIFDATPHPLRTLLSDQSRHSSLLASISSNRCTMHRTITPKHSSNFE